MGMHTNKTAFLLNSVSKLMASENAPSFINSQHETSSYPQQLVPWQFVNRLIKNVLWFRKPLEGKLFLSRAKKLADFFAVTGFPCGLKSLGHLKQLSLVSKQRLCEAGPVHIPGR